MTANATVTVRPLPTAYDPPTGPMTVATPSCCCSCCCCCCLNAVSAGVGVAAGAAYGAASRNRLPAAAPTILGVLAVPAFIGLMLMLASSGNAPDAVVVGLPFIAFLALVVAALGLAGISFPRAALMALGLGGAVTVAVGIEFFLAIFTIFVIELFFPASLVGGFFLGRRLMGYRGEEPGPQGYRGFSNLPPAPGAQPAPGQPPWPQEPR